MDKEKRIDELTALICGMRNDGNCGADGLECNYDCVFRKYAERVWDEQGKIEYEAWNEGFSAAINEGGYRKASTVAVETIREFETRIATHFGTYTKEDVVKVSDVFALIHRIVLEMLEDGE